MRFLRQRRGTTDEAVARSARTGRPGLVDRISCVRAPVTWVSPTSGQLRGAFDGLYVADRRALSLLTLTVNGREPEPFHAALDTAPRARFVAELAHDGVAGEGSDPTLICSRWRTATTDGGTELISIEGALAQPVAVAVRIEAGTDLASLHAVVKGNATTELTPASTPDGLIWRATDGAEVRISATPPAAVDSRTQTMTWSGLVGPGRPFEIELRVRVRYPAGETRQHRPTVPSGPAPWAAAPLRVSADDARLGDLVRRGESDLDALLLSDPLDPADTFFAAGSPWYLTLFGRDSIWAARLALAFGYEPLLGALRALARRQGTKLDADVDEEPGKILHELRSAEAGVWRAPAYYGTIDATALFVSGVADALRWGAPREQIGALMPAVEAALSWMVHHGDADGDGFLEYSANDRGLANQSWKDSRDSVQWADGRLAVAPLALSEVQAYAHQAALDGAWLLERFALPHAGAWREWARELKARFLDSFIVTDESGAYPAIALDAQKRPVDGPASNMGHLVGTGILTDELERAVAARLVGADMATGFGIRTLARTARGYNPLGYHTGSVWPHDNTIAMLGLQRAGQGEAAREVLSQLLAAAPHFDYQLPELYGGHPAAGALPPIPYPAACRPQAWAAATGPAMVRALLGLEPDATRSSIVLRPMRPSPVGAFSVRDLRVCGGLLAVRVDAEGRATIDESPPGITVTVAEPPAGVPAPRPAPAAHQDRPDHEVPDTFTRRS